MILWFSELGCGTLVPRHADRPKLVDEPVELGGSHLGQPLHQLSCQDAGLRVTSAKQRCTNFTPAPFSMCAGHVLGAWKALPRDEGESISLKNPTVIHMGIHDLHRTWILSTPKQLVSQYDHKTMILGNSIRGKTSTGTSSSSESQILKDWAFMLALGSMWYRKNWLFGMLKPSCVSEHAEAGLLCSRLMQLFP